MRKSLKKTAAVLALTAILFGIAPRPASAVFGVGDVVYDPAAVGQLIANHSQLAMQLGQLIAIYNTFEQYKYMWVNQMGQFERVWKYKGNYLRQVMMGMGRAGEDELAKDPEIRNIMAALNKGLYGNIDDAFKNIVLKAHRGNGDQAVNHGDNHGDNHEEPVRDDEPARVDENQLALMDEMMRNTARVTGTYRAESAQLDDQLEEMDRQMADLNGQSQTAILQRIAGAQLVVAREIRDTNRILAAMADQTSIQYAGDRNARVNSMNAIADWEQQYSAYMTGMEHVE